MLILFRQKALVRPGSSFSLLLSQPLSGIPHSPRSGCRKPASGQGLPPCRFAFATAKLDWCCCPWILS